MARAAPFAELHAAIDKTPAKHAPLESESQVANARESKAAASAPARERYLIHRADQGAARNTLLRTARELLVIAERLDLTTDQMISIRQVEAAAEHWVQGSPPRAPRPDSPSEWVPSMVHPNCPKLAPVLGSLRSARQKAVPFCRLGRTLRSLHARPARFV